MRFATLLLTATCATALKMQTNAEVSANVDISADVATEVNFITDSVKKLARKAKKAA